MQTLIGIVQRILDDWGRDEISLRAASLAFSAALSLAPLLVIVIVVAGFFVGEQSVQDAIYAQVVGVLGPDAARFVQDVVSAFQPTTGGIIATIISAGIVLFVSVGLAEQFRNSLKRIWKIPPGDGPQGLVGDKLAALTILLIVGVFIGGALAAGGLLQWVTGTIPGVSGLLALGGGAANVVISLLLAWVAFLFLFGFVGARALDYRDITLGAFITAMLFVIAQSVLAWWLGRPATTSIWGAAGSLVVILLFLNFSAQIVLGGAVLTKALARENGRFQVPPPPPKPPSRVRRWTGRVIGVAALFAAIRTMGGGKGGAGTG